MGDGLAYFDIIVFAALAAFLIFRLRSILGRRTGHEKRRGDPFAKPAKRGLSEKEGANVVRIPGAAEADEASVGAEALTLAMDLRRIAAADRTFDKEVFRAGAAAAFGWIVEAFAKGDTETLRPLLSNNVYEDFATAIEAREHAGETLETNLARIKSTDLLEAQLEGRAAFVTVKFISDQVNVTRDRDGEVIDGEPGRVVEVTDIWTFARNTRSRDPNWTLVATRSPH